ncbi:hypothetical protein [Nocardia tengchongensis]|uniref:hypothetical protein n=1 Tax=Nocardia tengchongensis TaxID=2055889 RepID=UPI0036553A83
MAYMPNEGSGSVPGIAGRVAGALLVTVGALLVAASFVALLRSNDDIELFAWKYVMHSGTDYSDSEFRVYGAGFVVAGVLAVLSGALLAAGVGARRPVVRWLGGSSAGAVFAVSATGALSILSWENSTVGPGFWLLTAAGFGSAAALTAVLLDKPITPPDEAGGTADRISAAFLILASALMIGSEALVLEGYAKQVREIAPEDVEHSAFFSSLRIGDITPVAIGIAAFVVAILLFAGIGMRSRAVRTAGGIATGAVFWTALMQALDSHFESGGPSWLSILRIGFYIGILAVVVSAPAIIASLMAQLAKPAMRPPSMPGYAPGFLPSGSMPAGANDAVNPFAPVSSAPNPFAPAAAPNPLAATSFAPAAPPANPFAPAPPAAAVEATVKIEPAVTPPRMARVYDGKDADGRPVADRPAVEGNMRMAVLAYLESAPIVLAARSFEQDEFVPGDRDVPLNFRSDGVWVWAGAVPHYLHKHGLAPEPELVQHIANRGYRVGEIGEAAQRAAIQVITGS